MTHEPTRHSNTLIFPASLDPDAVTVVNRLNEAGLESYFVGGCVRDLLLGLIPKDFDISTAARPRQIRRLFRNSRIIGRRFKLAHIHFGRKIIEVATFRRTPEGTGEPGVIPGGEGDGDDLLITRDNEFGNAEQDAVRRDFTINALLYDVRTNEVIDYVGGVADLNDRVLRTIGDPLVRFSEDPVRMLRAVKFISRLGLQPAPDVQAALSACAERIELSAPPRVLEEIYKLMTCGRAAEALTRLLDSGLLQRLLPEVAGHWAGHRDELTATGAALDLIDHGGRVVSNAFLLAALGLQPWRAALAERPEADPLLVSHELFDPAALRMSIPRRDITGMRQILLSYLRLEGRRRSRRFRMRDFLGRSSTEEGVQLLHLAARAGYADPEVHAEWAQRLAELGPDGHAPAEGHEADEPPEAALAGAARETGETGPRRRRRRRRGGRRHRGRHAAERGREARAAEGLDAGDHARAEAPAETGPPAGDETASVVSDSTATDAPPAEPGAAAAQGERGSRRRRRRGGRRHRDRRRDRGDRGDRSASAAAPGESPAGAAEPPAGAEPGEPAARPERADRPDRPDGPGRDRGRRRSRRGRGASRGERSEGGSDESLSPARPSKSSTPAPGSRLRDNPENVEDLFDW